MASSWPTVQLGDVVDLTTGFPFDSSRYAEDLAGIRLLRGDNVAQGVLRWDGAKRWPHSETENLQGYFLKEGDVVLAMDRPWIDRGLKYASIHSVDLPALLVQRVARLRGKERLDTRYLTYVIGGEAFTNYILGTQTGTTIPHISAGQIRDFRFALPPLPVQRAIARILGTLDDKIELNRQMNETLESMARALFKSWFIDFDPVRAKSKGSDPGLPADIAALFPDSFEDSDVGEIPKGWAVRSLGELIKTVKGCSYTSDDLVDSDTALVTLKSFARGGGYRPDGLKSFAGSYKPEQVVTPGELVIACTDVTQAAAVIGRTAVVRGITGYRTLVASLDTLIVRPNSQDMTRSFLYFLGRTDDFVAHTYSHTTGTTVLHLAKEAVPSFAFVLPPAQLVRVFDSLANPVLSRIEASDEQSETIASLRDALLPKLLSGELRTSSMRQRAEVKS